MNRFLTFFIIITAFTSPVASQVQKVIVETYYISDAIDATDTIGGGLEEGSYTCRIFIDLATGNKLKRIYGNESHPLTFSSTESFFNNADRGELFGYKIRESRLDENTVALDSWLTIGFAAEEHMGILKEYDPDGSIIGGQNNDGGSAEISGGLLVNDDPDAGIPLVAADGLVPNMNNINDFTTIGFSDASIFGQSGQIGFTGTSTQLVSQNTITGSNPDNIILVAQLTTKGDLSFKLNIEVEIQEGVFIKYVSNDTLLQEDEEYSNWLSYPPVCGCTDPFFIQYDPEAVCDDGSCKDSVPCGCKDPYFIDFNPDEFCHSPSACKDSIVLGCMDPYACNYDPAANLNIKELCCYPPDNCDNRDISIVCPDYNPGKKSITVELKLYPNPATDQLTLEVSITEKTKSGYAIYDTYGNLVLKKNPVKVDDYYCEQLDVSNLQKGLYLFQLITENNITTRVFIIN